MRRRLLALGLGIALPTVLLGVGWLRASRGEREAEEREQRASLERSADTIRAAVDEGLEELRRREDARPFYLYNHFYSPPDVVAVNDPVAVTPLAREPEDARIVGYFQLEPDGTLSTPYTETPDAPSTARSRIIVGLLSSPEFAELRALTHAQGSDAHSLLAAAARRAPEPTGGIGRRRPHPTRSLGEGAASARTPGETPLDATNAGIVDNPYAPQGPLTVNLNTWGQQVFEDIQAAQAGSVEANRIVQARGRAAPVTRRRQVAWDTYGAVSQQAQSSNRAQQNAPMPEDAPMGPTLTNITQREAEVGYTDMAWYPLGPEPLLHRIISHEGAAVVQGVVLDRTELVNHWLPALVERHGVTQAPRVIAHDEQASCAFRRPVSDVLTGVDLCYPVAALASATASRDASQRLEAGALLGLLLIVGLALFAFDRAARRSDDLARQKSAFVSAVSHELRTPLTTIRMHAEMLEEGLVSEARRPRVYGELVHESVRLARLVENVLEISRLEEGQRPLHLEQGDLRAHVSEIVDGYRPFVERKSFSIVGPEDGTPIEVLFDVQAVEQIVINLIDNAVKYAAESERRIEVSVDVEAESAVLRVRNHGPGIPADQREKVFERFHRVDRPDTAHSPGTGIGLSLVRTFSKAHHGQARVREAEGGGAEIMVTFPLA